MEHDCGPLCPVHGDPRDTSYDQVRLKVGSVVGAGRVDAIVLVEEEDAGPDACGFVVQLPNAEAKARRLVAAWNAMAGYSLEIVERAAAWTAELRVPQDKKQGED